MLAIASAKGITMITVEKSDPSAPESRYLKEFMPLIQS